MAGFLERRRERKEARKSRGRSSRTEDRLVELLEQATGSSQIPLDSMFHPIGQKIAIASANAGRLPEITPEHLISKKGEIVHVELIAELQKEVTLSHREFVGRGAGVSVRIAKGVRVHTGGGRGLGYTVFDGTELQTEDTGILGGCPGRRGFSCDGPGVTVRS